MLHDSHFGGGTGGRNDLSHPRASLGSNRLICVCVALSSQLHNLRNFVKTPTDKTRNFRGRADSMNFPSREHVQPCWFQNSRSYLGLVPNKQFLNWNQSTPSHTISSGAILVPNYSTTNKPPCNRTDRAHAPSRLARCGRRGSARCSPGPPPPFPTTTLWISAVGPQPPSPFGPNLGARAFGAADCPPNF